MCVVWYARLFGILRENALCAHDITYAGHYEKSLLRDNDSRYYLRKMKIISSDWIALLHRLLINDEAIMAKLMYPIITSWLNGAYDSITHRLKKWVWHKAGFVLKRYTFFNANQWTAAFLFRLKCHRSAIKHKCRAFLIRRPIASCVMSVKCSSKWTFFNSWTVCPRKPADSGLVHFF